jgi:ABC-type glutathione transport system ATPase component
MSGQAPALDAANGGAGVALLELRDVQKHFRGGHRVGRESQTVYAVDGVSFDLQPGETLGLVGESGCGKSTLARVLTGLYAPTAGTIRLHGDDLVGRGSRQRIGGEIQMVFQDPASSLDPRHRIASSVAEPLLGRVPWA